VVKPRYDGKVGYSGSTKIDVKKFQYWRRLINQPRLRRATVDGSLKPGDTKPIEFVPVKLTDIHNNLAQESAGIVLILNSGHQLGIKEGFCQKTLINVLTILEKTPCQKIWINRSYHDYNPYICCINRFLFYS
jgi:hypothetical protein